MHLVKSFLCYKFFITLVVGAEILEKDDSHEITKGSITSLPIALQLSKSIQNINHEILQPILDDSSKIIKEYINYPAISNDIEVFKENLGQLMEKQEVEPEAEDEEAEKDKEQVEDEPQPDIEAEPEAEPGSETEAGEEEAIPVEADAQSEPKSPAEVESEPEHEQAVEGKEEPEVKEEPETGVEPEEQSKPEEEATDELEPVVESEPEPSAEEKKEDDRPETETNPVVTEDTAARTPNNDESEMVNDEPSKDGDVEKDNENVTPTTPDIAEGTKKTTDTKTIKKHDITCFACSSDDHINCNKKPTQQALCPEVSEGDKGKHNGCFTLYEADTNKTLRGCVDGLSDDGLQYCLKNEKFCSFCYENGCNDKLAVSSANILRFNIYSMLIFNIFIIIVIKNLKILALI